eukprot:4987380-Amphidinium_carterae.1
MMLLSGGFVVCVCSSTAMDMSARSILRRYSAAKLPWQVKVLNGKFLLIPLHSQMVAVMLKRFTFTLVMEPYLTMGIWNSVTLAGASLPKAQAREVEIQATNYK